jgi:RNase P subunit RPR2
MRQQVLDFLSAYYPRFMCSPCLARLMIERETTMRTMLVPTIAGLEYAVTECMGCGAVTRAMRFKPA